MKQYCDNISDLEFMELQRQMQINYDLFDT